MRLSKILASMSAALVLVACGGRDTPLVFERPNVIVIGLDTVRADHLGPYGQTEYGTPYINEFAAESVVFTQCSAAAPWTLPSFVTAFTGLYPYHHGVVGGKRKRLSARISTLAEILGANGYATKGFGAVGYLVESFGASRGIEDMQYFLEGPVSGRSAQYQPQALEFLMAPTSEPYFLLLHYFDAHAPYEPLPPFDRAYYAGDPSDPAKNSIDVIYEPTNRAALHGDTEKLYGWLEGVTDIQYPVKQYGGDISALDATLGKLFDTLRISGQMEESIVVLMADHGEHLTEHDTYFTHALPYQECLHVPLMIRLPGGALGGIRVEQDVSLVDLLPTLLDLMDLTVSGELDGVSLVPAMRGEEIPERWLVAEQGDVDKQNLVKAIWNRENRLLYYSLADTSWYELYDRRADPAETVDLYGDRPEVDETMTGALWSIFKRSSPVTARVRIETQPVIDPEVAEKLRALGYTQ